MRKWMLDRAKMEKNSFFAIVCIFVIFTLLLGGGKTTNGIPYRLQRELFLGVQKIYLPGTAYEGEREKGTEAAWIIRQALTILPLGQYLDDRKIYKGKIEDKETIAKILASQADDGHLVEGKGDGTAEVLTDASVENIVPPTGQPVLDMSIEKLRDFDYLLSNFYIVDSTTMIGPEQLNPDDLLNRSMKITQNADEPKILIFHTHSQEEFADSIPGDPSTSIVGVGEYLTQLLNAKGIPTIHDTGVYDIINGQLDRSNAYENAEASIRPILEANPSVEVVIDLHRDGVAEGTHLVTDVGGKPTAKIMYFNGLSRTRANGDIDYLYNPYIQDNLAFSLQMQIASETLYPGFARRIYLRGYRYNLHLMPKSLLIEAGAQTNTVEEMRNAMEVLAETLYHVLVG